MRHLLRFYMPTVNQMIIQGRQNRTHSIEKVKQLTIIGSSVQSSSKQNPGGGL